MKLQSGPGSIISICFPVLILLANWVPLRAQELHTSYDFLGFSADLKYCAYEMYSAPPTEFDDPISIYYFIDVDKNDYCAKPLTWKGPPRKEDEMPAELSVARAQNRKAAEVYLKKFNISGKKFGTRIDLHLPDSVDQGVVDLPIGKQTYQLSLGTIGTGKISDFDGREEVMAVVDLRYNGKTINLQKASKAPQSWGFIIGYEFVDAYYLDNKLAVFINYLGPGFEGYPDRQQMIVTGILPK